MPVAAELHTPSILNGALHDASSAVVLLSDPLHVHVHVFPLSDGGTGLAVPYAQSPTVGAVPTATPSAGPQTPQVLTLVAIPQPHS